MKSNLRRLVPRVLLATTWLMGAPLHAQRGTPPLQTTPAMPDTAVAQQFLYVVYPEFLRQALTFRFARAGAAKAVTVIDATNPLLTGFQPPVPLLTATIELATDGQLVSYAADGRSVSGEQNRALRAVLAQHPEWTDADTQVWLSALGAVAGPSETDAARIAVALGRNAQRHAPTLRLRDTPVQGVAPAHTAPGWRVDVDATNARGNAVSYRLRFEPITGRLIAAVRQ